ncbi:ESPR-type extended signal peptide-containing protein [Acinetobacter sp. A47]|uniref:ESPR-type extended signal peptide-containing protein n=1 Tax=Acinetobacter sp. A47 TaxID=1561217 RepID=UPI000570749D|nr:ESPR-type extended signal peptide-containing protein [Acinetobacter sp. A47]
MNKFYKVVWNASLGAWVAVSEIAKAKTRTTSKKLTLSTVIITLITGFSPSVWAATGIDGGTGNGTAISGSTQTNCQDGGANTANAKDIAIGCSATTLQTTSANILIANRQNPYNNSTGAFANPLQPKQGGSISLGTGARTESPLGTAIGSYATTQGVAGISLGTAALSSGNTALAIGRQSAAIGDYSQAIGNVAAATGKGSLAIGHSATAEGYRAIAIGSPDIDNADPVAGQAGAAYQPNMATKATGKDSIAFGGGAIATKQNALAIGAFSESTGDKSVSIGTGSKANQDNAVVIGDQAQTAVEGGIAIGQGAQANAENSISIGQQSKSTTATGNAFLTNQAPPTGVLSIGDVGQERRIQNVADGSALSDAVTVAQLDRAYDDVNNNLSNVLGGNSHYDPVTNTYTPPSNLGGTGKNTIDDALKAVKTNVVAGTNTNVVKTTDPVNGNDIYTVNADSASVSAAPALQVSKGTKDSNNNTDYQIDLAQSTKDDIKKGVDASNDLQSKGLTFNGDSGTTGIKKLGDTVSVTGDNNITTEAGAEGIQVKLNPNLDLGPTGSLNIGNSKLDNTGLTIINGPSITSNGIDAGNKVISNVSSGGNTLTNAANIGDVQKAAAAAKTALQNGTNVNIGKATDPVSGNDIYTVNADSASVSAAPALQVSKGAKDSNNNTDYQIDLAQSTKDDIKKGVDASNDLQSKGLTFNGDSGTTGIKKLGDTVSVTGDNNITTEAGAEGIQVKLNPNLDLGPTGSLNIGNSKLDNTGLTIINGPSITSNGIDAGNKKIINVANGTIAQNSKDAVNGAQIHNISESIKNSIGGNTTVNPDGSITTSNIGGTGANNIDDAIRSVKTDAVKAKTTVSQGSNISVKQTVNPDGSSNYEVSTNKDLVLDSVQTGDSVLNNNGLTIKDGPSVTKDGIDAADKKITHVANGSIAPDSKDAVNGSQISNISNSIKNSIGGNTIVNPDGTISTNNVGGTGSDTIDGAIHSIRNDAKAARTEVTAGNNITVINKGPGANGQDVYEVATAKDVSFNSVSSQSVNVGQVKINENGINAGNQKITNVANGSIGPNSKDAINGSQLNVTNNKIVEFLGGGAGYDNITNSFTNPTYKVDGKDYKNVGNAIDALNKSDQTLNNKIDNVSNRLEQAFYSTNQRIDDVEKKANAGIAAAMALENAPYIAGKYTYAVGAAYHSSESAVGITLRKTADNGRWSLTGGIAAASHGDPSVRVGISGVID